MSKKNGAVLLQELLRIAEDEPLGWVTEDELVPMQEWVKGSLKAEEERDQARAERDCFAVSAACVRDYMARDDALVAAARALLGLLPFSYAGYEPAASALEELL